MVREFHDLAERLLNLESDGVTAWGNLGFWATATTYPEACAALADQLAERLHLEPDTRLIDIGFGCGDQLRHWMTRYGVQTLAGLNLSQSQTRHARQRLIADGQTSVAAALRQASVTELRPYAGSLPWTATTLVALDCAYHFPSRPRFLEDAATVLPPGGRLGYTDLILARPPGTVGERVALQVICGMARIPHSHLIAETEVREQWCRAGLELQCFDDLTADVLRPFGDWLGRYRQQYGGREGRLRWTKYEATARVLRWADQRRLLRYVVCVGQRAGP